MSNKQGNNQSCRILIIVENVQRDLPGHMLLKRILEEKFNHEVKLFGANNPRINARIFKPHAVILPALTNVGNKRIAYYFKSKEVVVFHLPTEGWPTVPDDDFIDHVAGVYSDFRPVDLNFVWSEEIARRGAKNAKQAPQQTVVSGLPRLDFYHENLTRLRLPKDEFFKRYQLNPDLPTITWASNYPAVFVSEEEHEVGIRQTNSHCISVLSDANHILSNEKRSLQLTVDLLSQWLEKNKDVNFIIRPHPLDDRTYFKRFREKLKASGLRNVVFIPEGPIWDILSSTDILVQRACTTAVEAFFFGLPVIELRLNENELLQQMDRDDCLDLCKNYQDFEKTMSGYLLNRSVNEKQLSARTAYVQQWFYKVDGRRTIELATKVAEYLEKNKQIPLFSKAESALGYFGRFASTVQRSLGLRKKKSTKRGKDTYLNRKNEKYWKDKLDQSGIVGTLNVG